MKINTYFLLTNILALLTSGCVSKKHVTYKELHGPIYNQPALTELPLKTDTTLKVVSYNIEHSKKVDKAIEILRETTELSNADILCLQEMDHPGVQKIASELGYGYIYYPSVRHAFTKKDFGNAILSRWPISDGKKHILPAGRMTQMQRIMIGANVRFLGERNIQVYCLHDDVYLSAYTKRDMAKFVLNNIPDNAEYVIVAGDFNTYTRLAENTVKKEFEDANFISSTPNVSWTSKHWYLFNKKCKIDEIYSQNMEVINSGSVTHRVASDHRPIWTQLQLEDPQVAFQK